MNQTSSISNCSNCGTPREKVDTKFCKKCGMKYNNESFISSDLSPSNTDVQRFICSNSNCSRTFLEGRFCKQCGSRLIKLEEISAFSISQRVTSPPPQRSSSPPSNQRFSSPGPQRPLSVLFGNKEDLKENPEFSFKARTREDRSFSIGTANFNHCSTCNIMGTGKFCNSCGTLFDSVSDLLTTVGTEVQKSSGKKACFVSK